MSELTRKEKVSKLNQQKDFDLLNLACMTCEEINNLYDEHFEKITEEDFEGFEKVVKKLGIKFAHSLDQIKKELGL